VCRALGQPQQLYFDGVVQPNTKHSSGFRSKAQIDLDEVVQSGSGNTTLPKSRGAADHVRGSWACRRAECAGQRQQLYLDGVVQPNTSVKLDMPASECGGQRQRNSTSTVWCSQ
jgi:hypothetical protein